MSVAEPEELIIEGAHLATRAVRGVWRRYAPPASIETVPLSEVRLRLELFVTALFRYPIQITGFEPPSKATWLARIARGSPHDTRREPFVCGTDGDRIFLPKAVPLAWAGQDGAALYRLLAVHQAARIRQCTVSVAARAASALARDWFLLATTATVDGWIAREAPGLRPVLTAARADALSRRPRSNNMGTGEHALESEVRALLAQQATPALSSLGDDASGVACLAWAERMAAEADADRYRGVAPIWYGGKLIAATRLSATPEGQGSPPPDEPARRFRVAELRRRPRPRLAADDEDDLGTGVWVIRADEPQESVEDPYGMQRPADRDDKADTEGLADSLSELPEARVVRTPGQPREVLRSDEHLPRAPTDAAAPLARQGISYPEWDYRAAMYREPGAVVHEPTPQLGDPAWVANALSRYARQVREVRTKFERLKPRRERLTAQLDGADIDIDAYVTAASDLRAGRAVDGRFYVTLRPARRELSVALLVDISASTDAWVTPDRRIIDVAKEALLVVCSALDALGDQYGIFAFSGESAGDVAVLGLKRFEEPNGASVRRRIAGLDYDRYTRLGAALRHVTAALGRLPTSHQLLLVLSDGKPNDVDAYEGRYGVEDTRQAVAEARRQGIVVFCLTIDREAPRYAARVFGRRGFAVLRKPDQLPVVLTDAIRRLLRL